MFFMGVNTLFNALMNTPGFERDGFLAPGGDRGGRHGAAELVAARWKQITGCLITRAGD
jgi:long-chain acyl-CoA synthetase